MRSRRERPLGVSGIFGGREAEAEDKPVVIVSRRAWSSEGRSSMTVEVQIYLTKKFSVCDRHISEIAIPTALLILHGGPRRTNASPLPRTQTDRFHIF